MSTSFITAPVSLLGNAWSPWYTTGGIFTSDSGYDVQLDFSLTGVGFPPGTASGGSAGQFPFKAQVRYHDGRDFVTETHTFSVGGGSVGFKIGPDGLSTVKVRVAGFGGLGTQEVLVVGNVQELQPDKRADRFFTEKVYADVQESSQAAMQAMTRGQISRMDFFSNRAMVVKLSSLFAQDGNARAQRNLDTAIDVLRTKLAQGGAFENRAQVADLIRRIDAYKAAPQNAHAATITGEQLGLLAVEIFDLQARELCIDSKDANNAVRGGQLSAHPNDLGYVEIGLGTPERESTFGQIVAHRTARFTDRFGHMDDVYVQQISDVFSGGMSESRIREEYGMPFQTYRLDPADRGGNPNSVRGRYDSVRERYLDTLEQRLQPGADGSCAANTPVSQFNGAGNHPGDAVSRIAANSHDVSGHPAGHDMPELISVHQYQKGNSLPQRQV